jgi:hypothetical protein
VNSVNRLQSYLNLNEKIIFTILVVRLTFPFTLVVDLGDFAFLVLSSGFVASLIVIRFSALDPSSVGLEIDSCSPVVAAPQDPARAPDSSHTLCVPARLACLGSLSFFLCGSSLTTPSINFCAACFFFSLKIFPAFMSSRFPAATCLSLTPVLVFAAKVLPALKESFSAHKSKSEVSFFSCCLI